MSYKLYHRVGHTRHDAKHFVSRAHLRVLHMKGSSIPVYMKCTVYSRLSSPWAVLQSARQFERQDTEALLLRAGAHDPQAKGEFSRAVPDPAANKAPALQEPSSERKVQEVQPSQLGIKYGT